MAIARSRIKPPIALIVKSSAIWPTSYEEEERPDFTGHEPLPLAVRVSCAAPAQRL
jgi:hypothetical protein